MGDNNMSGVAISRLMSGNRSLLVKMCDWELTPRRCRMIANLCARYNLPGSRLSDAL